jgi:hypothetical protein
MGFEMIVSSEQGSRRDVMRDVSFFESRNGYKKQCFM